MSKDYSSDINKLDSIIRNHRTCLSCGKVMKKLSIHEDYLHIEYCFGCKSGIVHNDYSKDDIEYKIGKI